MDRENLKETLRPVIVQASRGRGFSPAILHGLIEKESNYKVHASSPTGVRGLCQITKTTAREVIEKNAVTLVDDNILLPQNQIIISSVYLQNLLNRSIKEHPRFTYKQHLIFALQSYNCGYGSMTVALKRGGWSNYKSYLPVTADKHYAEKVLKNSTTWKPINKDSEATKTIVGNEPKSGNTWIKGNISPILGSIVGGFYLFLLARKILKIGGKNEQSLGSNPLSLLAE